MNEEASTATAEIPAEARKWAMICHLAALAGLLGNGIGFLLGPLIVWLAKRDAHPFVDRQGKEAVNFQITAFIALFVSALLCLLLIGFGLLLLVGLAMIVMPIIAAVRTNEGDDYRYPLTIRFIK